MTVKEPRAATPEPAYRPVDLGRVTESLREAVCIVRDEASGALGVLPAALQAQAPADAPWTVVAQLPPLYPEWLGDRSFTELHGVRFPYVAGAMANGIASTELVSAMAEAGFLSFFGAAGLDPERIEAAIDTIESRVGTASWGSNLIHSPNEPDLEETVADLYVRRGVRRVSAAAYMSLTPSVVRYAYHGLTRDAQGVVRRQNHLFAKISRPEVARRFMEPAPTEMLQALVAAGKLTSLEAELAAGLPVAQDFTVESDSGGHTDNRPLNALLPTIAALRDEVVSRRGDDLPIRLGAAGGLGTPAAVAAAFALGAAYVVTGSVNQGCVESGLHEDGKKMLAQAGLADVVMAPAADMFELGVEVQVLRRGTLFAARARKLHELYRAHESMESIPAAERQKLERDVLRATIDEAWQSTRQFWLGRDPREAERGDSDAKHRMALVFRSYLGQASKWAIHGLDDRRGDYQIWCGPAMGAFNAWTAGSFLEDPAERTVVQVARNLMEGAAQITRAQQLRVLGVPMPAAAFAVAPRRLV